MTSPINPVVGAVEAFLAVYNNLPFAFRSLVSLALFLFTLITVIQLVLRFRG